MARKGMDASMYRKVRVDRDLKDLIMMVPTNSRRLLCQPIWSQPDSLRLGMESGRYNLTESSPDRNRRVRPLERLTPFWRTASAKGLFRLLSCAEGASHRF